MLGLSFAPLRIPIRRRLQTLAVFYFCAQFLFLGFVYTIGMGSLMFTEYYWITLLYLFWFIYDRKASYQGGHRRSWMRNLSAWKYFADFFPVKLMRTAKLSPDKNYIFGCHPHGILSFSHFVNFATEGTGFSKLFPKIVPHLITLNYQFWLPIHRDIILLSGTCEASRESIEYIISGKGRGNAAAIVIGGANEVLKAAPNQMILTLKRRKGFVRLAIKHGASLVPVLSFGENDLLNTPHKEDSLYNRIQEKIIKFISYPIPIFFGRGVFQYTIGLLPFRKPITTIVGKPIDTKRNENPTQKEIDDLHQRYIEALMQIFEENKDKYCKGCDKLIIK
ncbi:2-acylglycerol O-acyltransferase 1 [Blomia tropicalis]|nr:2-acylglycerol O-acyltransferase 1 [Blomia tropicalis]